jgi:hypothetical protein
LVAEELFAAGQYVGGTKEAGGGMAGSDVFKVIVAAVLVVATLIGLTGTNIMETLFTL